MRRTFPFALRPIVLRAFSVFSNRGLGASLKAGMSAAENMSAGGNVSISAGTGESGSTNANVGLNLQANAQLQMSDSARATLGLSALELLPTGNAGAQGGWETAPYAPPRVLRTTSSTAEAGRAHYQSLSMSLTALRARRVGAARLFAKHARRGPDHPIAHVFGFPEIDFQHKLLCVFNGKL